MSSISASAGIQADADKYLVFPRLFCHPSFLIVIQNASTSYLQAWQSSSTVSGHLVSSPNSGPALIYNIYPDRLLKFNLVDDSVTTCCFSHLLSDANVYQLLDSQNSFYLSQATSGKRGAWTSHFVFSHLIPAPKYGLPFDSSVSFAKSRRYSTWGSLFGTERRSDWTAFTAATAEDRAQDALIDMIYSRINTNTFTEAFPSVHDVNTGAAVGGAGR